MIVAVPKGVLTAQSKSALTKKGYIVIECDDPDKIRVINPEQHMDTSDWFMSALFALKESSATSRQERFVNNLYERLKKKESDEPTNPTP